MYYERGYIFLYKDLSAIKQMLDHIELIYSDIDLIDYFIYELKIYNNEASIIIS